METEVAKSVKQESRHFSDVRFKKKGVFVIEAIRYEDRKFSIECCNCRALLNYQKSDVYFNNITIKVPHVEPDYKGDIRKISYKDAIDNRPYVKCPICDNRQYI